MSSTDPGTGYAPGDQPLREVWRSGVRSPLTLGLLAAIRGYQRSVSLALGPVCRFYPSCSHYGFEALRLHGAVRGSYYTARRLLRCHPWNAGGVDHVPPPRARRRGSGAADADRAGLGSTRGPAADEMSGGSPGSPRASTSSVASLGA